MKSILNSTNGFRVNIKVQQEKWLNSSRSFISCSMQRKKKECIKTRTHKRAKYFSPNSKGNSHLIDTEGGVHCQGKATHKCTCSIIICRKKMKERETSLKIFPYKGRGEETTLLSFRFCDQHTKSESLNRDRNITYRDISRVVLC